MAGLLGLAAVLAALGPRPGDPATADPVAAARRLDTLRATAVAARDDLDRLLETMAAAVEDARQGSARIVSGDEDPEPALLAAADTLRSATGELQAARASMAELAGRLRSTMPGVVLPPLTTTATDLAGMADQLEAGAAAAGPFVERRQAATATLESMADALSRLEADDPAAAQPHLTAAAAARERVADWEDPPPALAVWLCTTGAMIAAASDLAEAALAGDRQAADAAARAYAEAAEEAGGADRALALSIAEAGSGLTLTPMQRLAAVTRELEELRAAVDGLTR